MPKYDVPGVGGLQIETIILDLNGTMSVSGKIVPGLKKRLGKLKEQGFKIIFFTGNTRDDAGDIASELGIDWMEANTGTAKKQKLKNWILKPALRLGTV